MADIRLGRIYREDPRDREFLMERRFLEVQPVGAKLWDIPHLYDQGQTPRCVGFGTSTSYTGYKAAELHGSTVVFDADALYLYANSHDGDPNPHDGSTVRAGLQSLVDVGDTVVTSTDVVDDPVGGAQKAANYLWADVSRPDADIERIITWILNSGPVVIGVSFYSDMMRPDANGYLHPTGAEEGGHCTTLRGVHAMDPNATLFVIRNTWGQWGVTVNPDWSVDTTTPGGDALITKEDLVSLLRHYGEAGSIVDSLAPVPPAPPPVDPVPPPPVPPTPTPTPPGPQPGPAQESTLQRVEDEVEHLVEEVEEALHIHRKDLE